MTRWKATGYVERIGWLAAWGPSLITALVVREVPNAREVVMKPSP